MAALLLCRTVWPAVILPPVDIPLLLATTLEALVLECWLAPGNDHGWLMGTFLAAVTFGLFPLCVGLSGSRQAFLLAAAGGLTFLLSTVLFDSMVRRFESGFSTKAAPALAAFVLFLAGQGFANIIF